jgi:hypothetical protein
LIPERVETYSVRGNTRFVRKVRKMLGRGEGIGSWVRGYVGMYEKVRWTLC